MPLRGIRTLVGMQTLVYQKWLANILSLTDEAHSDQHVNHDEIKNPSPHASALSRWRGFCRVNSRGHVFSVHEVSVLRGALEQGRRSRDERERVDAARRSCRNESMGCYGAYREWHSQCAKAGSLFRRSLQERK
jgi:hypothetical protein